MFILKINLNGNWIFKIEDDQLNNSTEWTSPNWIEDFINDQEKKKQSIINIPSNTNNSENDFSFKGIIWYFCILPDMPHLPLSHDYSIYFDGSNYHTSVWLNGHSLGSHEGGYIPFFLNFSPKDLSFTKNNFLAIKVDTALAKDSIPSKSINWINKSGIHRNIYISIQEKVRIFDTFVSTSIPQDNSNSAEILVNFSLKNSQDYLDRCYAEEKFPQIEYEIYYLGRFFDGLQQFNKVLIQTGIQDINPESLGKLKKIPHNKNFLNTYFSNSFSSSDSIESPVDLETFFTKNKKDDKEQQHQIHNDRENNDTLGTYKSFFKTNINNPILWNPDSPELYELVLVLQGSEENNKTRFGIRQIRKKRNQIFLNNKSIQLKGILIHEEEENLGQNISKKQLRKKIIKIKAIGFNALRAHLYPHDESLLNIADEEGMMVMEELPISYGINYKSIKTFQLAYHMLKNLIFRDINHPSVVIWSVANNLPIEDNSCKNFIKIMIEQTKSLDSTRLVTYTNNSLINDRNRKFTDISCLNLNLRKKIDRFYQMNLFLDVIFYSNPENPWIISNFGVKTIKNAKNHKKQQKSEELQSRILINQIEVFNSKYYFAGWFLNCYKDYSIQNSKKKKKTPLFYLK